MAKRYGRTLIAPWSAGHYAYAARASGSDHADVSGRCKSPVMVAMTGLQDGRLHRLKDIGDTIRDVPFLDWAPGLGYVDAYGAPVRLSGGAPNIPVHVDLAVPCRRCEACLKRRAFEWTKRARVEIARASRTWFGTLTIAPENWFMIDARARLHCRETGRGFDQLDPNERFRERHRQISFELTKFVKRVRKQSKASIRFLLVAEAHKSGLPHYHMLVHEAKEPVRERVLNGQWQLGFSQWRLVRDEMAASYICKYVAKSALARLRASKGYGSMPENLAPPGLEGPRPTRIGSIF